MSNVKPQDIADLQNLLLSKSPERERDLAIWFHARSPEFANFALASLAYREDRSERRPFGLTTFVGSLIIWFAISTSISRFHLPPIPTFLLIASVIQCITSFKERMKATVRLRATLLLAERQDERCIWFLADELLARYKSWRRPNALLVPLLTRELTRLTPTIARHTVPRTTVHALEKLFRRIWKTNQRRDLTEEQTDLLLAVARYLVATRDDLALLSLQKALRYPARTPYRQLVQETVASLLSPSVPPSSQTSGTAALPVPSFTVVGQQKSNSW